MAITFRTEVGRALTHLEMDQNFSSLYYSSSLENSGTSIRLWFNNGTSNDTFHQINLPVPGAAGTVTIIDDTPNALLFANGNSTVQAAPGLLFDGTTLSLSGRFSPYDNTGNIAIGLQAGANAIFPGVFNTGNILIGEYAGLGIENSIRNIAIGTNTLNTLFRSNYNIAIGEQAGSTLDRGSFNVYLGASAGPPTQSTQSKKLYISSGSTNTPLIFGDFGTGHVTINTVVSASRFSGSFRGDGSGLTGVTSEWDGTHTGTGRITGSLIVSGAVGTIVDFTGVTAISGSTFSGSFRGDGSGLTGVTGTSEWDGTRNGNAEITGSFIVSGSSPTINLRGVTTIDKNIVIKSSEITSISIGSTNSGPTAGTANVVLGMFAGDQMAFNTINATVVGYAAGRKAAQNTVYIGEQAGRDQRGGFNVIIGSKAGSQAFATATGTGNTVVGAGAAIAMGTSGNTVAIGFATLNRIESGDRNVAVGGISLGNIITGTSNVAIGTQTGFNAGGNSSGNVYIGDLAGPSVSTIESGKLYINNQAGDPLIGGDFYNKTVTISGSLLVSQSVIAPLFTGSFQGDGSGLTGVGSSGWNGIRSGSAQITGSLIVSGAVGTVVDFTRVSAISGSIFSGSFRGDGSGITGIVTTGWNGIRSGSAEITGSLTVISGSTTVQGLTVKNTMTISTGSIGGASIDVFHYTTSSLSGVTTLINFPISPSAGYAGFKADYVLTTPSEAEKKVGTILGSWDRAGNSDIIDTYSSPTGDAIVSPFTIDATSTTSASLSVNAFGGNFEINMLVTAFKRPV